MRILATLLHPDGGTARVGGFDVVREAERVRPLIGLTGATPTRGGDGGLVSAPVQSSLPGSQALVAVASRLDAAGIAITEAGLRLASLDEVFLALTGHHTSQAGEEQ